MANLANKYKLGVFVVSALTIFIIALFLFGFFAFLKQRIHCFTIVSSSVQGLSVGAKVKFNGVPVGKVTGVEIARGDYIYIYMDIFTEFLHRGRLSEDKSKAFREYVQKEIKKGIRCQLRYEGITGTLYQEIQYFDLKDYPKTIPQPKDNRDLLYIPSIQPVLLGSIMSRIDVSLGKMSGIDEIFREVGGALKKVNAYLDDPKIDKVLNNMAKISKDVHGLTENLKDTLTKERINELTSQLSEAMKGIKLVAGNLNKEFKEGKIPETLAAARVLMETTVKQFNDAITNFNTTAKSVKYLSDELGKNPSSLIWGDDKEKVVPSY